MSFNRIEDLDPQYHYVYVNTQRWLKHGLDHELVVLPLGWDEQADRPLYSHDPSSDISALRQRGIDAGALEPRGEAHFHTDGWVFLLVILREVFTNASGQLIADYLRSSWLEVQNTMARVTGGNESDHLEGQASISIGFYEDGGIEWFEAKGDAETVIQAFSKFEPPPVRPQRQGWIRRLFGV